MIKTVSAKLNSKRGASMVIALVFMLICLMVAAVIIASVTANSTKVQNRSAQEQAYLAVKSAEAVLHNNIAGAGYEVSTTSTTYECGTHTAQPVTVETPCEGTAFDSYINTEIRKRVAGETYSENPAGFTLNLSDSGTGGNAQTFSKYDIAAEVTMMENMNIEVTLTATLKTDSKVSSTMSLVFPAAGVSETQAGTWVVDTKTEKSVERDAHSHSEGTNYDITTTKTVQAVEWQDSVIVKGTHD